MGGIEIEIEKEDMDDEFNENLAENLDDDVLVELAGDLIGEYQSDIDSRKDWVQTYVDGLELLALRLKSVLSHGLGRVVCTHLCCLTAIVKFQSETIMETFPAAGPVKTSILGQETQERIEAAQRVKEDMNYQLTEVMVEYRLSMSGCSGALGFQVMRSRRSTSTDIDRASISICTG
jgi:hypothetical protein